MKIPAAKAAVDKEWEKLEKISAWNLTKVRVRKRWSMKQGRRAQKLILPHWWTYVIWRMLNWRQSTKSTKVRLFSEVILWKTILALTQYSLNKGHQHLKWQQQKSRTSYPDCQVRRTSSWRSICLYPGKKWKMLGKYWKFPNRDVQTFGFVYQDTNGLNHGLVWKIQSFLLSETCTVIFQQNFNGDCNSRKLFWESEGKTSKLGMLIREQKERTTLVCVRGRYQNGRYQNGRSNVENTRERSWFGRANIIPRSWIFALRSTRMQNKQRYCGQLQRYVWVQVVSWRYRKVLCSEKSEVNISSWFFDIGGSCNKCLIHKVATPCIDDYHFKEEEMRTFGELSKVCSQIVLKCLYLARNWPTWCLVVSEQACPCHHEVDESMWQTFSTLDLLHSSHKWIKTILSCGKNCTSM